MWSCERLRTECWLSSDQRIDDLIPVPCSQHTKLSLGKILIPESSVWMFTWMATTEQVIPERVVSVTGLNVCANMTLRSHTFTWGKASMQTDTSLCDREPLTLHYSSLQNVSTIMAEIVLQRDVFLLPHTAFLSLWQIHMYDTFPLLLVNKQCGCLCAANCLWLKWVTPHTKAWAVLRNKTEWIITAFSASHICGRFAKPHSTGYQTAAAHDCSSRSLTHYLPSDLSDLNR